MGYTPFEIVYEYTSDFTILAGNHFNIPTLDKHLNCMIQIWKEAEASLCQTKLHMKKDYEATKKHAHLF